MPGVDILSAGGPIIAVLAVLSLLSFTVIGAKCIQLRHALKGRDRRMSALDHWEQSDTQKAETLVQTGQSPADRILGCGLQELQQGKGLETVERSLEWRANQEMSDMMRYIRLLELIAMISPLLGLLGTVLGMIQAFQELAAAEGAANASLLAMGIWQALLTTAAGLIVAIPAAIAAGLLNARVDRAGTEIETAVNRLLSTVKPK